MKDTVAYILVVSTLFLLASPSFTLEEAKFHFISNQWRGTHGEELRLLANNRISELGSRSSSSVKPSDDCSPG